MPGNAWAPGLAYRFVSFNPDIELVVEAHEGRARDVRAHRRAGRTDRGGGPRLAEVPSITGHPFISPYEDLKLKGASP